MEKLKQRIKWSNEVLEHHSVVGHDPSYVILQNQIVIMETLLEMKEELDRTTKKPMCGCGPH